jgi:cellobiose dehydrogenase (acceptor)
MTERLLIATWPNDDTVMSSMREATDYVTPPVYTNSSISLLPIESGTFVNDTALSYTFVCSGCITGDILTFSNTATANVFSWALSATAVTDATDDTTALTYHAAGASEFSVTFSDAQSADYATWAAMASAATTTSSSSNSTTTTTTNSSSNSTSSYSSSNVTATVSNVTYDYIVAGGGAAGVIVAERLVESGASVLLLERGGASLASTGGEAMVSWNSSVTQYDVPAMGYYLTTANDTSEYCTDTASMAGCILGGSTMVNALMWVKPQAADFDDKWPSGWKWADVEAAAEKLYERNPGTNLPSADGKRYDQGVSSPKHVPQSR